MSPKIQLMDPALVDKIAAGEVVRGPFSILKELVENALDAGARQVHVELSEGGIGRLLVRDDGGGIARDQLVLALQRSASSKIRSAADLFELSSFGFRGEALASIAAVSQLQLYSKTREQTGGKVWIDTAGEADGKPPAKVSCQDWDSSALLSGTIVEVQNLFATIPARKKFLRSARAEFLACKELLQAIAMSRPDVSFSLHHNDKEVFSVDAILGDEMVSRSVFGEDTLRRRAAELFPKKDPQEWQDFIYLDARSQYGSFEALMSPPGYEKATSRHMRFYVNGRVVQDKMLRAAVMRGYHSHLLQSRYPQMILFVKVDPALVDANVHPAKQEVKFQFGQQIQDTLAKEIRGLIRAGGWTGSSHYSPPSIPHQPQAPTGSSIGLGQLGALPVARNTPGSFSRPGAYAKKQSPLRFHDLMQAKSQSETQFETQATTQADSGPKSYATQDDGPSDAVHWGQLSYIGCFYKCYLLFEASSGLLAVDQHAFHERILYEQLLKKEHPLGQSQPHLIQSDLGLDLEDVSKFKKLAPHLETLGFGFDVSDSQVFLQASPELLHKKDLMVLFHDVLAEVHAGKISVEMLQKENGSSADYLHTLYATIACHSAVRSGEELTGNDVTQLLVQAETVDFSSNCPHGRRVFKWFSPGQVGSWFDR